MNSFVMVDKAINGNKYRLELSLKPNDIKNEINDVLKRHGLHLIGEEYTVAEYLKHCIASLDKKIAAYKEHEDSENNREKISEFKAIKDYFCSHPEAVRVVKDEFEIIEVDDENFGEYTENGESIVPLPVSTGSKELDSKIKEFRLNKDIWAGIDEIHIEYLYDADTDKIELLPHECSKLGEGRYSNSTYIYDKEYAFTGVSAVITVNIFGYGDIPVNHVFTKEEVEALYKNAHRLFYIDFNV